MATFHVTMSDGASHAVQADEMVLFAGTEGDGELLLLEKAGDGDMRTVAVFAAGFWKHASRGVK